MIYSRVGVCIGVALSIGCATAPVIEEQVIPEARPTGPSDETMAPIVVMNGSVVVPAAGVGPAPQNIRSIEIVRADVAVDEYGAEAAGGVIRITTRASGDMARPVVVLRGRPADFGNVPDLSAMDLLLVDRLRGADAIPRFGPEAAGGAILITTRPEVATLRPLIFVDGARLLP